METEPELSLDERVAALCQAMSASAQASEEAAAAICSVLTWEVARDMLLVIDMGMVLRPAYADVRALLDGSEESHK